MFRLRYILSWIALIVIVLNGLLLVILSWNKHFTNVSSPVLLVCLWVLIIAASIYLHFFATKQLMPGNHSDTPNSRSESEIKANWQLSGKMSTGNTESIKIDAVVRKLIRGISNESSPKETGAVLLRNLAKELEIMSGLVYFRNKGGLFKAEATYAFSNTEEPYKFKEGEGLTGQVAKNKQLSLLSNLPDVFLKVSSGLGSGKPGYLAMIPVVQNNQTIMVIECSGYKYEIKDLERIFQLLSRDLSEKIGENNNK